MKKRNEKKTKKRFAKKDVSLKGKTFDRSEESIVEKVFNERNLTGFVEPTPFSGTRVGNGNVIIKGEVTPKKLKLAEEFETIFNQSVGEIMDLEAYTPREETLNFVKSQNLSQKKIDEIKNSSAWTTFQIAGETLMKTQDNKLENVKDYCFRLERAVLEQVRLRNEKDEIIRILETVRGNYKEKIKTLEDENSSLKVALENATIWKRFWNLFKLKGVTNG